MDWTEIFKLLGGGSLVAALITAITKYFVNKFRKQFEVQDEVNKALKLGIQALLRDRLLQGYRYYRDKGYATYEDRMNWENLYKQYHSLGENGVMDDIRNKFLALPTKAEE